MEINFRPTNYPTAVKYVIGSDVDSSIIFFFFLLFLSLLLLYLSIIRGTRPLHADLKKIFRLRAPRKESERGYFCRGMALVKI